MDRLKVSTWHVGASCVVIRGEVVVMTPYLTNSTGESQNSQP